ncbi:uncharacterized protein LOC110679408 [Aedes aegypti]|uniref:Uncharacterized protein n=1 Tax=Aedes aegypti TaxID=7159 RepID=A0A6I8U4I5_AEDAE|nr:uncharacterized protein LOC110679408 [Aedes aegypti]
MSAENSAPLDLSIRPSEDRNATDVIFSPEKSKKAKMFTPRKSKAYLENSVQDSVDSIRKEAMSTNFASKFFGVPRTTLQYRLSDKCKNKGSTGPYTIFTVGEELGIVTWLRTMERKGFPVTRSALVYKISSYLEDHPRKHPFKDNVPGYGWFRSFLKRHPQLSIRTPESVTLASAKVSEKNIREWFHEVKQYLIDVGLIDILHDPSRIYNGDESGFVLNPVPKKVIATSGAKNVPFVETGSSKQNITVLMTFCADGSVVPPDVILALKRLSKEIVQSFPADWGLGTSENGWMNTQNFILYVKKILYPYLIRRGVKFPVLFFVDGHKSHTALEAADACKRLGIILIALYPNATRILQPADVGAFKPLKTKWYQVVERWKMQNKSAALTLTMFGPLLQKAMDLAFTGSTVSNAFAACGLFPYNPDAVDYSKCIAGSNMNNLVVSEPPGNGNQDNRATAEVCSNDNDVQLAKGSFLVPYHLAEKALEMLGTEKLQLYTEESSENLSHEDQVLAFICKNILNRPNDEYTTPDEPETSGKTDENYTASEMMQDNPLSGASEHQYENFIDPDGAYFEELDCETVSPVAANGSCTEQSALVQIKCSEVAELERELGTEVMELSEGGGSPDAGSSVPMTATKKSDNPSSTPSKLRLVDYLDTPDDLKRISKHRNYQIKSFAVLTADERLQEILLKENKRKEAEKIKQEKAEKRALKKIKLDEEKENKKEQKLKRKAEKEAEKLKKAEEKRAKAEIKERKKQEMGKKNGKARKSLMKL